MRRVMTIYGLLSATATLLSPLAVTRIRLYSHVCCKRSCYDVLGNFDGKWIACWTTLMSCTVGFHVCNAGHQCVLLVICRVKPSTSREQ
ncbi:hypothetical protein L596_009161 [Steinernema carpocapsae]|uniref:Secreted protein n=1 Tax=Steinernema carpocapsae TaxID=34508 RepID=A0A4V6A6N2_STECR|nr:hypothetical protein L596_009161 [Steinernema carpocapsae]